LTYGLPAQETPVGHLGEIKMTDSGNYAARATAIRETAKWIAAVFAGTGAVLFSGLSFTNIEKIANTDAWILPVFLATVPILAAAVAVRTAAGVISQDPPNTAQLLPELARTVGVTASDSPLRTKIKELLPATVATFGSIEQFEERLIAAHVRVAQRQQTFADQPTPENRKALDAEYEKLGTLQEGVRDLVLCADFIQVKECYGRARWILLVTAILGVAAAAASGVLAAQAGQAKAAASAPAALAITDPTSVRVYVNASRPGTPCPMKDGQSATAIGGTFTRPLLLFLAIPATEATAGTPEKCLLPWTWAPPPDQVVVVPETQTAVPASE
jgi:hypothetical protein